MLVVPTLEVVRIFYHHWTFDHKQADTLQEHIEPLTPLNRSAGHQFILAQATGCLFWKMTYGRIFDDVEIFFYDL